MCHGRIARAMGSGGLYGVLSRQLGASGSQGGQRGVGDRQDRREGLRDGSPALSSLWGRGKLMTQRQESPSQGQTTEYPPGWCVRGCLSPAFSIRSPGH